MKKTLYNSTLIVALAALIFLASSCSDSRTAPTSPAAPSYNQTVVLFDRAAAAGADKIGTFTPRDTIVEAQLYLYGFLKPDAGLNAYTELGVQADSLKDAISGVDGQILNIRIKENKTHEDSVAIDSLQAVRDDLDNRRNFKLQQRDSLDTVLDDRFKISVWLDNDPYEYYPNAVFLDSTVYPFLHSDHSLWGQGFFLTQPDTAGWRGMRIILDLSGFWVADGGWDTGGHPYIPTAKPKRGNPLPELYPIRNWITRMTPNAAHIIHIRFGSAGTATQLTSTLYVVYKTAQ